MDNPNSVNDSLQQLIALQAQQVNALNSLVGNSRLGGIGTAPPPAQFNGTYQSQAPNYIAQNTNPYGGFSGLPQRVMYGYDSLPSNSLGRAIFGNPTKIAPESRQAFSTDIGNRIFNAGMSASTGFASLGASYLGGSLGGGLFGSLVGGTVSGAATAAIFAIGQDQVRQAQAYDKFLLQNSMRFINPAESRNERGQTGFSTAERHQAARFLRNFNSSALISDEDTMRLLGSFTEGGLMRQASNLQTFQTTFSKLVKFTKQAAITMQASYKETADLMAEMEKIGINSNNFTALSSKAKISGSYMGLTATQALQLASQGAGSINVGTGVSSSTTASNILGIGAYVSSIFDQSKNSASASSLVKGMGSLIANAGGSEQATLAIAQKQQELFRNNDLFKASIMFYDYDRASGQFKFNQSSFNKFNNNQYSAVELMSMGQKRLSELYTYGPEVANAWLQRGGEMLASDLSLAQSLQLDQTVFGKIQASSPNLAGRNVSAENLMSLLFQDNSAEGRLLGGLMDYYRQDNGQLLKQNERAAAQESIAAAISSTRINNWAAYNLRTGLEGVKDNIGNAFQSVWDKVQPGVTNFWDELFGTNYATDRSQTGVMATLGAKSLTTAEFRRAASSVVTGLSDQVNDVIDDLAANGYADADKLKALLKGGVDESLGDLGGLTAFSREVFANLNGLSDNLKTWLGKMQQTLKNSGVSETLAAATYMAGQSSGNPMNLTSNQISTMLSAGDFNYTLSSFMAQDETTQSSVAAQYMGQMLKRYGMNQNLAMAAYYTSPTQIDALIAEATGQTVKSLSPEALQSFDLAQIINNGLFTSDVKAQLNDTLNADYSLFTGSGFNGSQKGLASDVSSFVSKFASAYGVNGNALATMFATETGGRGLMAYVGGIQDGSQGVSYGAGQVYVNNEGVSIASEFFGNGAYANALTKFNSRWTADYVADHWRDGTAESAEIQAAMGGYYYTKMVEKSGGSPVAAYAMYNYGESGATTKLTALAAQLGKAVSELTPEEIASVLGDKGQNVLNFANKLNLGVVEETTPIVSTQYGTIDATGSVSWDDSAVVRALNSPGVSEPATGYNSTAMTKLTAAISALTGGSDLFGVGGELYGEFNLSDKQLAKFGKKRPKELEAMYQTFATALNVSYDGSADSLLNLEQTVSDRYNELLTKGVEGSSATATAQNMQFVASAYQVFGKRLGLQGFIADKLMGGVDQTQLTQIFTGAQMVEEPGASRVAAVGEYIQNLNAGKITHAADGLNSGRGIKDLVGDLQGVMDAAAAHNPEVSRKILRLQNANLGVFAEDSSYLGIIDAAIKNKDFSQLTRILDAEKGGANFLTTDQESYLANLWNALNEYMPEADTSKVKTQIETLTMIENTAGKFGAIGGLFMTAAGKDKEAVNRFVDAYSYDAKVDSLKDVLSMRETGTGVMVGTLRDIVGEEIVNANSQGIESLVSGLSPYLSTEKIRDLEAGLTGLVGNGTTEGIDGVLTNIVNTVLDAIGTPEEQSENNDKLKTALESETDTVLAMVQVVADQQTRYEQAISALNNAAWGQKRTIVNSIINGTGSYTDSP